MSEYKLPKKIESLLAMLSKVYEKENNRQLQELVVNSQIRVHEGWSSDNWNGGTYGHAIYFSLPQKLFLSVLTEKENFQNKIQVDLNKLHNFQSEFVEEVFIEMEDKEDQEWRKESGVLLSDKRFVSADANQRIWGQGGFRLFLSHKSAAKKETANIKAQLDLFGIKCFVAHEDIHPTKAWQDEIENALSSMDAFAALMTEDFHESDWTDQEVGFAFAKGVPLIAVRLGKDPYGFIGKFQALSSTWETAGYDIAKILIKNERMFDVYIEALRSCSSWDNGNLLAKVLPGINKLNRTQIDQLVKVYNTTKELRGSFGFRGSKPRLHGLGLVKHLDRLDCDRQFEFDSEGLIAEIVLKSASKKK